MDVQRYLADEPVQACPPSAGYRLRKFARRNKGPVLAASLVLAALVIGIVGTTWGMIRATRAEADAVREAGEKTAALGEKTVALGEKETALATAKANALEAHKQETLAKENAKTAKEQELLARRRFYAAQGNLAQQAWEAGQPARALELLESQRPKLDQEDLRGFDWYYLWRLCHRNLHRTLSGPKGEAVYTLAITPDGKTLVSGSTDASVRVWDVATGKERAVLTGHKASIWRLAISPDGKMVASASMDHDRETMGSRHERVAGDAHGGRHHGTLGGVFAGWRGSRRRDGSGCARTLGRGSTEAAPHAPGSFRPDSSPRLLSRRQDAGHGGRLEYQPGPGWRQGVGRDVGAAPDCLPSALKPRCAAFSPDSKLLATCDWRRCESMERRLRAN